MCVPVVITNELCGHANSPWTEFCDTYKWYCKERQKSMLNRIRMPAKEYCGKLLDERKLSRNAWCDQCMVRGMDLPAEERQKAADAQRRELARGSVLILPIDAGMKISPGKMEKLRRQQENQRSLSMGLERSDSMASSKACEGEPGEVHEGESGGVLEDEHGAVREGDF